MTVKVCPRCQQRYIKESHSGDFVHQCFGNSTALTEEDVPKMQGWTDYTGKGNDVLGPTEFLMLGIERKNWGMRSEIEGENIDPLTKRGRRSTTHRVRAHFEYITDEK